jgi:ABC-type polysaccharide/polyol phosphate transport system ATPase subunit
LMIRQLCNKALWLNAGMLMGFGEVDDVLDAYAKSSPARA